MSTGVGGVTTKLLQPPLVPGYDWANELLDPVQLASLLMMGRICSRVLFARLEQPRANCTLSHSSCGPGPAPTETALTPSVRLEGRSDVLESRALARTDQPYPARGSPINRGNGAKVCRRWAIVVGGLPGEDLVARDRQIKFSAGLACKESKVGGAVVSAGCIIGIVNVNLDDISCGQGRGGGPGNHSVFAARREAKARPPTGIRKADGSTCVYIRK